MPNTKSARKAARQSARRRTFNLKIRDSVKEATKTVRKFLKDGKKSEAVEALRKAMSALNEAVKKGVLYRNTSARKKSRLAKALAK